MHWIKSVTFASVADIFTYSRVSSGKQSPPRKVFTSKNQRNSSNYNLAFTSVNLGPGASTQLTSWHNFDGTDFTPFVHRTAHPPPPPPPRPVDRFNPRP